MIHNTHHCPAVPSDIMTREDRSQFTLNTASITLTWSTSTVVDSYTIVVIPQSPAVESRIFSTTIERVQLTVQYNEEYSINITAQNCAGTNSVIVPLFVGNSTTPSTQSLIIQFMFFFSQLAAALPIHLPMETLVNTAVQQLEPLSCFNVTLVTSQKWKFLLVCIMEAGILSLTARVCSKHFHCVICVYHQR